MTGNLPGTTLPLPEGQQDALFTVLASQDYAAIQDTLESSYQICMSHRVDHR